MTKIRRFFEWFDEVVADIFLLASSLLLVIATLFIILFSVSGCATPKAFKREPSFHEAKENCFIAREECGDEREQCIMNFYDCMGAQYKK